MIWDYLILFGLYFLLVLFLLAVIIFCQVMRELEEDQKSRKGIFNEKKGDG